MPALVPSAISLLRPALGLLAVAGYVPSADSVVPLTIVIAACASDFFDGRIARGMSEDSMAGRLVDNLCDFAFLMCMFAFYAGADLWSPPVWGNLLRRWDGVNWLPVYALLGSFGLYFVRLCIDLRAGRVPEGAPRGHAAGVANYALAILGAIAMLPDVDVGPRFLETVMVGVVVMNMAAVLENGALLFHRERGGPRMPA